MGWTIRRAAGPPPCQWLPAQFAWSLPGRGPAFAGL